MQMSVPERRKHNLNLALELARAGLFVFPSDEKQPLIPGWQHSDTRPYETGITYHGSTRDQDRVRSLWAIFPDAVPSISLGPSGLVVIDADTKKNGPTLLREWLIAQGHDISDFPVTHTQSDGLHVYVPNTAELGCSAGFFSALGCDIKGVGGQVVAPGAVRPDGRFYRADHNQPLLTEYDPSLAECPQWLVDGVRSGPANKIGENKSLEAVLIDRLEREDWPDPQEILDPRIEGFDLDQLKAKDSRLRALLETGTAISPKTGEPMSHSEALWHLSISLHAEYGDAFSVLDFAALIEYLNEGEDLPTNGAFGLFVQDSKPKAGEFDYRQIARAFMRGDNDFKITDGSALAPVEVEDDGALPPEQQAKKDAKKPFDVILASELAEQWVAQQWVVKDLIPARGIGLLYGGSNIGKSFLTLALADALERNVNWLDQKTKRNGTALYVPGEGTAGLGARMRALALVNGEVGAFGVVQAPVIDLFENGKTTVANIIKAGKAHAERSGKPLRCVIIDTLAACAPGIDENSAGDVNTVLANARAIETKLGCAVLIVHHEGKNKDNGIRGSSALRGNVDFALRVRPVQKDDNIPPSSGCEHVVASDKQRDAGRAPAIPFVLHKVVIGEITDDDQEVEPVRSCVAMSRVHEVMSEAMGPVDEEAADLPTPEVIDSSPESPQPPDPREERERLRALALEHDSARGRREDMMAAARMLVADGPTSFRQSELWDAMNYLRRQIGLGPVSEMVAKRVRIELSEDGLLAFASVRSGKNVMYKLGSGVGT